MAVAASSAFPPFFPPVKLRARALGVSDTTMRGVERFTDGGVFDNSGVRAALAVTASGALVVSDASAGFDQATDQSFGGVISRTVRTSDVLMSRVAALEDDHLRHTGRSYAICKISDLIGPADLPHINAKGGVQTQSPAVQKWIKNVRTDLDKFPIALIRPICRHGYETGLRLGPQLSAPGTQFVISRPAWTPGDTRDKAATRFSAAIKRISDAFRSATTGVAPNNAVETEPGVLRALRRGARRWVGVWSAVVFLVVFGAPILLAAKFKYWDERPRPPDLTAAWDSLDAGSPQSQSLRRVLDGAGLWPIMQRLTQEAYAFSDQNRMPGRVELAFVRSPTFGHPVSPFEACLRFSADHVRLFPAAVVLRDDSGGAFAKPARVYADTDGWLKLQVPAASGKSYVVVLVAAVSMKPDVDPAQIPDQLGLWSVCDESRK